MAISHAKLLIHSLSRARLCKCTVIADSLSRIKFQVFKTLCPEASPTPIAVPPPAPVALYKISFQFSPI